MNQPSLLDAIAARDEALDRVDRNADERWKTYAYDVVRYLCDTQRTFSTDDVWDILDDADVTTHEPRALGAVVQRAKRDGLCRPTGNYVQSTRPECHARPVAVWESLR